MENIENKNETKIENNSPEKADKIESIDKSITEDGREDFYSRNESLSEPEISIYDDKNTKNEENKEIEKNENNNKKYEKNDIENNTHNKSLDLGNLEEIKKSNNIITKCSKDNKDNKDNRDEYSINDNSVNNKYFDYDKDTDKSYEDKNEYTEEDTNNKNNSDNSLNHSSNNSTTDKDEKNISKDKNEHDKEDEEEKVKHIFKSIVNLSLTSIGSGGLALASKVQYLGIFWFCLSFFILSYLSYFACRILMRIATLNKLFNDSDLCNKYLGKKCDLLYFCVNIINTTGVCVLYQLICK